MTIKEAVEGKKILIWGYGREGKSSERYLRQFCNCELIDTYEGTIDGIDEDKYDLILKSPGIVMDGDRAKYTSQTELFLGQYRDQVIGITGTKGKSTTSAMMAHVLADCTDKNVILLGNIGLPCMDYCPEITDDTIIVFEMSCHQLKHTKVSPHISIFLNLYEEHLDYYKTMDAYFTAKSHVASYQNENDYYFCGENVPEFATKAKKYVIDKAGIDSNELKIYGEHNQLNAKFVRTIAVEVFGCKDSDVSASLKTFTGLPHRLQSVGEYKGIEWYDDSISTIPEAAISALESIPGVYSILIGGMDRGISYEILEDYMIEHHEYQYICMYETGRRIAEEIAKKMAVKASDADKILTNMVVVDDLAQAVSKAVELTPTGRGCVMSPAAASYGYFKNFEERGEVFCDYIRKLH